MTNAPADPGQLAGLRRGLAERLGWAGAPARPEVEVLVARDRGDYDEQLIAYRNSEAETIRAYVLRPHGAGPFPGVVVHHQHNSQWHLGKSEVAGHGGDPLQAFGPALAARGCVVLAPDAICFEDRRRTGGGVAPRADDRDQHYREMAYRLVEGSLLMATVVADAALAVSVLGGLDGVETTRLGVLGHSMGGHTVLFSAGLDERVRFACASGAACGYRARMAAGTPVEFAQAIPGILSVTDFDGLVGLIAPRPLLVVSADQDRYSHDAPAIVAAAQGAYEHLGAANRLQHARFRGGHPLTAARVATIVDWVLATAAGRRGSYGLADRDG